MNSVQPARYIKNRWGDDLRNKILLENGIINDVEAKSMSVNADCARCQLVNPLENKYCSACGYPLSVTAYEELKATENEELNLLKIQLEEKDRRLRQTVEALEIKSKNSIDKIEKQIIKLEDMIVEVTTDNEHGGMHYYKYKKA